MNVLETDAAAPQTLLDLVADAIVTGDPAPVREAIARQGVHTRGGVDAALMLASSDGDRALIGVLLDAGLLPDLADADGWTPLMMAVLTGRSDNALYLVERGADPYLETRGGLSAVAIARNRGAVEVLAAIGDVPPEPVAWQPLFAALEQRDPSQLQTLLAAGLPADAARPDGMTALMWATRLNDIQAVRVLLEADADVDRVAADGSTALLLAIQSGVHALTELLLAHGASPDGPPNAVMPPLAAAIFVGDDYVCQRLLDLGVKNSLWRHGAEDVDTIELAQQAGLHDIALRLREMGTESGPTDPVAAFSAILESGNGERLGQLLTSGEMTPDVQLDEHGVTPLMAVALYEPFHENLFAMLLDAGAHYDRQDTNGRTVFHHAVLAAAHTALERLLPRSLEHAAATAPHDTADATGRTPLHYAVLGGSKEAVRTLVTSRSSFTKPNIRATDRDGMSPLLSAALMGRHDLVAELLRTDDSPNFHQPGTTITLQDIARQRGDLTLLSILPYDRILAVSGDGPLTAVERRRVQEQLRAWGFYGGAIDGSWGPGTFAALNAYFREQREELLGIVRLTLKRNGISAIGPKSNWSLHRQPVEGQTLNFHYTPSHSYSDMPSKRYYFQTIHREGVSFHAGDFTYIGPYAHRGLDWGIHWLWWGRQGWQIGLYRRDKSERNNDNWPIAESLFVGGR